MALSVVAVKLVGARTSRGHVRTLRGVDYTGTPLATGVVVSCVGRRIFCVAGWCIWHDHALLLAHVCRINHRCDAGPGRCGTTVAARGVWHHGAGKCDTGGRMAADVS